MIHHIEQRRCAALLLECSAPCLMSQRLAGQNHAGSDAGESGHASGDAMTALEDHVQVDERGHAQVSRLGPSIAFTGLWQYFGALWA